MAFLNIRVTHPQLSLRSSIRLVSLVLLGASVACSQSTTTVQPAESNEILYNPGMGFADFHFGWGNTPPPSQYPTSRVAYFRWTWAELEPADGQFNFSLVDSTIAQAKARGQNLAFRIMPAVPGWLLARGVGMINNPGNELPDHNNALFLQYHERLVKAFGTRYAGTLDIDHVDIGSVGCWGEWNSACCPGGQEALCNSYMPTETNSRAIVDWYFNYFSKSPLVALDAGAGYPNTRGAGWRGDCFGDYGLFTPNWNHMDYEYPSTLQKAGVANAWKKGPVQFESCLTMQDWYNRGFNIDLILQRGLDWHMSVFNGKSSPVPSAWRPKVDEWLKKVGYRFVLTQMSHSSEVAVGGSVALRSSWNNKGVAPAYHKWPIAYRLRGANDAVLAQWSSALDLRTWLPGAQTLEDTVQIPSNATPGTYTLDVTILDEAGKAPFVKLANTGKRSDDWYPVSQLKITGGSAPAPAPTPTPAPTPAPAPTSTTLSGTAWIVSQNLSQILRRDFEGWVGLRVRMNLAVNLTHVGRYCGPGDTSAHATKFVQDHGFYTQDLTGTYVSIQCTGTPGWVYEPATGTLAAGGNYYVVTQVRAGQYGFYDVDTIVSATAVGSSTGGAWWDGTWHTTTTPNASFGPVGFRYDNAAAATPSTPWVNFQFLSSRYRNDFEGWVGLRMHMNQSITTTQIGRFCNASDTSMHQTKLVQDLGSYTVDVPGGSVSIQCPGSNGWVYQPAQAALANNANYYLVSQERRGQNGFFDGNTWLFTTGVASVTNCAWWDGSWHTGASGTYGPVGFKY